MKKKLKEITHSISYEEEDEIDIEEIRKEDMKKGYDISHFEYEDGTVVSKF